MRNAEFLVGKWEGTVDYFSLSLSDVEGSRSFKVAIHAIEKITYLFSSDGSYTYESKITYRSGYGGHYYAGGGGTWGFENEILVLSQTTKRHNRNSWAFNFEKRLRVYFFNKDEIGFQYASNQDLLDFTMANEANAPSSLRPQYRVGHDQYGFEVVRRFRPEYGSGGITLASPSRFKRVARSTASKPTPTLPKRTMPPEARQVSATGVTASGVGTGTPVQARQRIRYSIVNCKRETGKDFSYRFKLKLMGNDDNTLDTFSSVQEEFRDAVKKDYVKSVPGAQWDSLYVDFPEYELDNGYLIGRAVVMAVSVNSLVYDPNTRRGKLAVKVVKMTEEQFETTRAWIRKNIETLARDKNIALTSGVIPPAARFYLGREELKDGNILEIEFKTE